MQAADSQIADQTHGVDGVGTPAPCGGAVAVLRELAAFEAGSDARRAAISFGVAGLIDACGRSWSQLPVDVARQVAVVVGAVDRAAGLNTRR
jgi:hypothetical protein